MKLPQWLVWKCFNQYINVRFMSIVYSPMLNISNLTCFKWNAITAVFNVNGGVFLNSKKRRHSVKFQFCMLYINFWSEHLSVQFDDICFSTVVLPVWTPYSGAQRSDDARGDCLVVCPLPNSSIDQPRMVHSVTGYVLFVTSQYYVIFTFANQRFSAGCWYNMHIILHALSLPAIVQCVTIMDTNYRRSKLGDRSKAQQHSTLTQSQARSQGATGAIDPPFPKVALTIFGLIKLFMCKPKKCDSANQRNCLKKTILLQLLVESDQSSRLMVYQLCLITQTLCIVQILETSCHGWPLPKVWAPCGSWS